MSPSIRISRSWIALSAAAALLAVVSALRAESLAHDAVASATTPLTTPTPQPQAQPLVTVAKRKQDGMALTVKRTWWSAKKDQIEVSLTVKIPNETLKLMTAGDAKSRQGLLVEFRHADGAAFAECELDLGQARTRQVVFDARELYRRGILQIKSGICDPDISTEIAEQTIPDVKPGDVAVLKETSAADLLSATFVKTR
ncbi:MULTISPECIES: hypothetical protein [unclassified Methylococcus]|uniref:hypothetical protein n=1 Tax=unclassified Methylococcus TaxID=2618889 RepID=UPI003D7D93B5